MQTIEVQPTADYSQQLVDDALATLLGEPTASSSGLRDELSSCWGGMLEGTDCCSPAFQPRVGHFKNKVCPQCHHNGLRIELARIRGVSDSLKGIMSNSSSSGLWSHMECSGSVPLEYRLINHTAKCSRPALAILRAPLLPEDDAGIDWAQIPSSWLPTDGSGDMKLVFAKGTLCPAPSMSRASGHATRASGPVTHGLSSTLLTPGTGGAEASNDGGRRGEEAEEVENDDDDDDVALTGAARDGEVGGSSGGSAGSSSGGPSTSATPPHVVNLADLISAHERLSTLLEAQVKEMAVGGGADGGGRSGGEGTALYSLLSSLVQPLRTSAVMLRRKRDFGAVEEASEAAGAHDAAGNDEDQFRKQLRASLSGFAPPPPSFPPSAPKSSASASTTLPSGTLSRSGTGTDGDSGGGDDDMSVSLRIESESHTTIESLFDRIALMDELGLYSGDPGVAAAQLIDLADDMCKQAPRSSAATDATHAAVAATIAAAGASVARMPRRRRRSGAKTPLIKGTPIGSRRPSFVRSKAHGPLPAALSRLVDRHELGCDEQNEVDFDLTGSHTLTDYAIAEVLCVLAPHTVTLSLCRCAGLTAEGMRALACLSSLEVLDLSNTAADGANVLAVVSSCKRLRVLRLHGCGRLTDAALDALGGAALHSLRELALGSCRGFTDEGLTAMACGLPQLTSLAINGCANAFVCNGLSLGTAEPRWAALLCDLEVIDVSVTAATPNVFHALARHCPKLRRLNCSRTAVDDDALGALAEGCTNLEALVASACCAISDDGLRFLGQTWCGTLVELHLTGCQVGDDGLVCLVRACGRLENLSISNTHATDETIIELAACCPSLRVLNAQGCCAVGNAALTALVSCEVIEKVDIRGAGNVTAEAVAELLAKRPGCNVHVNHQVNGMW